MRILNPDLLRLKISFSNFVTLKWGFCHAFTSKSPSILIEVNKKWFNYNLFEFSKSRPPLQGGFKILFYP